MDTTAEFLSCPYELTLEKSIFHSDNTGRLTIGSVAAPLTVASAPPRCCTNNMHTQTKTQGRHGDFTRGPSSSPGYPD